MKHILRIAPAELTVSKQMSGCMPPKKEHKKSLLYLSVNKSQSCIITECTFCVFKMNIKLEACFNHKNLGIVWEILTQIWRWEKKIKSVDAHNETSIKNMSIQQSAVLCLRSVPWLPMYTFYYWHICLILVPSFSHCLNFILSVTEPA